MASAAAPTTFSLLHSTTPASSSSATSASPSRVQLSSSLRSRPLARRLGFAAADPLLAANVAARVAAVRGGKGARGVVSMAKKSVGELSAADLKGKKVFVRADLNVPLDDNQNITDDTRIRAAIPTIKHLIQNGAKVILSSHLGRPKGVTPKYSLAPLVPRLSELIGIQVVKAEDSIGPEVEKLVASLPDGGVLLLENVRFYKEEEKNDPEHAKKLASLADLFVNDAFGTAHRAHASTEGVTKYLKPSVAGFLLQKVVPASAIPDGWMGLDIGPDSVKSFSEALDTTQTIIWNGPMGVFEFDKFAVGTEAIAKKLADLSGKGVTTIIGGGDSVAAVEKVGVASVMSHISTGGGASLELLEGKELPGVLALDEAVPVAV
uniref:Phosphoglycerate kinase n=1 Tax=Glycine max TaxID=3847 RepID=I1MJC6_SOYBN